jgi:hypothetical protein
MIYASSADYPKVLLWPVNGRIQLLWYAAPSVLIEEQPNNQGRVLDMQLSVESGQLVDQAGSYFVKAKPSRIPLILDFHFQLACISAILLLVDVIGCRMTHVAIPYLFAIVRALILVLAGLQALPIYWHSKGRKDLRDASLTLLWFALFIILLPYPIDVVTKLGSQFPLQDPALARFDTWLGINVPAIAQWAGGNAFGHWITRRYGTLVPFMYLSLFLPALTGKAERAREFVTANFLMVLIGIPFLAFLPAVGPWYGFYVVATPGEIQAQADLFALRQSGPFGPYTHHFAAVVCFPSGHVMGAIFAAYSLWIYRHFRIPIALLSASIIFSTMTTEWHYFADVLGGAVEAFLLILFVRWMTRKRRSYLPGVTDCTV